MKRFANRRLYSIEFGIFLSVLISCTVPDNENKNYTVEDASNYLDSFEELDKKDDIYTSNGLELSLSEQANKVLLVIKSITHEEVTTIELNKKTRLETILLGSKINNNIKSYFNKDLKFLTGNPIFAFYSIVDRNKITATMYYIYNSKEYNARTEIIQDINSGVFYASFYGKILVDGDGSNFNKDGYLDNEKITVEIIGSKFTINSFGDFNTLINQN